jgi:hypothetical protein
MIMKKFIAVLFFAMVALNSYETSAAKPTVSVPAVAESRNKITTGETKVLTNRLKEIRTLAKGNLSAGEKSALREEVLTIEQKLNAAAADGVYISVGALILIIILLIILL